MPHRYLHYDVFTRTPFSGNQLAVFLDARGLASDQMQAITREMAFSESTFILPPEADGTDVRMRIFTPGVELPMAGHPTVGATFALAECGVIPPGTARFVFGLGVGPTPVDLEWDGNRLAFAWMTQQRPEFGPALEDRAAVAAALGLNIQDVRSDVPVQPVSCGVAFLLVPLASREAVDRAVSEAGPIRKLAAATGHEMSVFLFAVESGREETVYSRMFGPQYGITEDPATGSASGPVGCYLVQHGLVPAGQASSMVSLQGAAMGRPSRIHIDVEGTPADITRVRVGGTAVLVGRGELVVT